MPKYLRPEARPASWLALDTAQREVFRQVVQMITEAIEALPNPMLQHAVRHEAASWLSQDRSSRTVFLSGVRGTGKTTVLMSLIKASMEESAAAVRESFPDEDIRAGINLMRERVIWLEPVDMEPLPPSTNLLAAILARIEAATRWVDLQGSPSTREAGRYSERRGLLEPRPDYQDAMLELQRLQNNVALAWDGNLTAREGHLDPDSFAVEVMRTERARLSLYENLEMVLDKLARSTFKNPLFLLPIDDFDLNPPACLGLLRLLRMISVPRLFILVLGDVGIAETLLNLKLSNSLAQVADGVRNTELLSVPTESVAALAGEVAAHALRKLIPPTQRFMLRPMQLLEAFNFRPLGHDPDHDLRLHQLLAQCPVVFEVGTDGASTAEAVPMFSGRVIDNLREFLFVKGVSLIGTPTSVPESQIGVEVMQTDLGQAIYRVIELCETTPRRLTDLWFALRQMSQNDSKKPLTIRRNAVIQLFIDHCRSLLAEEPALLPETRRGLSLPVRSQSMEQFQLLTQGLIPMYHPDTRIEHAIEVPVHAYDPKTWHLQVHVQLPGRWSLCWADERERLLSRESSQALVLLHDLLMLGPERLRSSWLTVESLERLIITEWRSRTRKVELPCPALPPWTSFWEVAFFLHAWSDAIYRVRASQLLHEDALRTLAFVWIAAGTAVVERRDPVRLASEVTQPRDWQRLYEHLDSLVPPREVHTLPAIRIRNWLTSVAILVMPESGFPGGSQLHAFTGASRLLEFWSQEQQWRVIRRHRGLRLAQLVKNGMSELAERLRQDLPTGLSTRLIPGKDFIANLARGLDAFDDEETALETDASPSSPRSTNTRRRLQEVQNQLNRLRSIQDLSAPLEHASPDTLQEQIQNEIKQLEALQARLERS